MTLLAVLEEGFQFLVQFGVLFLECVALWAVSGKTPMSA